MISSDCSALGYCRFSCSLGAVTRSADRLKVVLIVGPALRNRHDVIDFGGIDETFEAPYLALASVALEDLLLSARS